MAAAYAAGAGGMNKFAGSAQEAKASLALMGEEIGVHIPRHIRGFIAMLPGVGQALEASFNAVAVTVSPTRNAPPVPLAPLRLILAAVTVGGWLSTVAPVSSVVVVGLPALSVAVTITFRPVVSIVPGTIV